MFQAGVAVRLDAVARMDATRPRRRLSNPFRRVVQADCASPGQLASSTSLSGSRSSLLSLPDDVLQLICFHAICQHPTQTWITPSDLGSASAQSWPLVCRAFRSSLYACVDRFSFFIVKNRSPTQRAASTHAYLLRSTLPLCENLRELQLFIRPRDIHVVDAVSAFFARTKAPLRTIHLCCAPLPLGDSSREPMPVVTEVIGEIAGRRERLEALSLDCCHVIGGKAARMLADGVGPTLERLALDGSLFQDWGILSSFPKLVELRLQNTVLSDSAMRHLLIHMPLLENLAIHQVSSVTWFGLEPLPQLQHLHTLELSRCIGIDNEVVLALARIPSLTTIRLVHIDVSDRALETLVRDMGPKLLSLSVNSISTTHDSTLASSTEGILKTLLQTVKVHCTNVQNIDFGCSSAIPGNHWSIRPYTEALQHPAPISLDAAHPPLRSTGSRRRSRRLVFQRPISCFY